MKRMDHWKKSHRAFIQPVVTEDCKKKPKFSEFSFGSSTSTLEILQDYACILGKINEERKDGTGKQATMFGTSRHLGLYAWGKAAEYIFMLSEYWGLQDESKYIALELFNKFMSSLVDQLLKLIFDKAVLNSSQSNSSFDTSSEIDHPSRNFAPGGVFSTNDKKAHIDWTNMGERRANREWIKTLMHVKNQIKLRAVTCVAIASKYTAHYEIVTLNKALDFLRQQGQHYSKSVLIKSELRILNSINFTMKFLLSPHSYINVILEILAVTDLNLNIKRFYPICIWILDLFYYFRPFILGRVCGITVSNSGLPHFKSSIDAQRFLELQNDMQFTSAAVVAASVYIKDKSLSDRIITILGKMTEAQESDISRFAYIILDITLAP